MTAIYWTYFYRSDVVEIGPINGCHFDRHFCARSGLTTTRGLDGGLDRLNALIRYYQNNNQT